MKEQCKFTIVLDLQISDYIEQVFSDVGQLPRTRMFVVTTFFFNLLRPIFSPTMTRGRRFTTTLVSQRELRTKVQLSPRL